LFFFCAVTFEACVVVKKQKLKVTSKVRVSFHELFFAKILAKQGCPTLLLLLMSDAEACSSTYKYTMAE
jgi:hypothetical protein